MKDSSVIDCCRFSMHGVCRNYSFLCIYTLKLLNISMCFLLSMDVTHQFKKKDCLVAKPFDKSKGIKWCYE